jgi:DNA-binding MarR family transcriptional regulator
MAERRRSTQDTEAAQRFFAEVLPQADLSYFEPVWRLLTVSRMAALNLERIVKPLGLTLADVEVLTTLRAQSGASLRATDLARAAHMTKAGLTSRLQRLVGLGLVERVADAEDRRAFGIALTAAGSALADQALRTITNKGHLVDALKDMAPDARRVLSGALQSLYEALYRRSDLL